MVLIAIAVAACAPTVGPGSERARLGDAVASDPSVRSVTELAGRRAPPFSLPSARGGGAITVPSRDVTVLIFFGSWSIGSSRGIAQLEDLRRRYETAGLRVLAVSMDETSEDAARFADTLGAGFPIAWSGGMDSETNRAWASGPYGGENSVFVLDRAGVVRFVHRGGKDGCAAGDPAVSEEIAALLAEPPAR